MKHILLNMLSNLGNSDGIPDAIVTPQPTTEEIILILSIFLNVILLIISISAGLQNLSLKSEMKELKKKSDKEDA